MKIHALAVASYLLSASTSAFTTPTFLPHSPLTPPIPSTPSLQPITTSSIRITHSSLYADGGGLLEPDDDDEDDEDDDDDDEETTSSSSYLPRPSSYATTSTSSLSTRYANLKLDPDDPNPPIKPRPGRYGFRESLDAADLLPKTPDKDLVQGMSKSERGENLKVMRQIKKSDLVDLRMRKDHAGWIEANEDLKKRERADPWYALNERCREAYQLGDMAEMENVQGLIEQVGGPPPGVTINPKRGYAVHTQVYDIPISRERAASALEASILEERVKRGRAMMAERKKNQEKEQKEWEDTMKNPLSSGDQEANERRERTMRRLLGEIEEDNKKKEERAKEVLGELPDLPKDSMESLDQALELARQDVLRIRKMRREGRGLGIVSDEADLSRIASDKPSAADEDADVSATKSNPKSSAARAREAAEAEAAGGRPRLPGDPDIKRGEIHFGDGGEMSSTAEAEANLASSTAESGPIMVKVTSSYNTDQSDPPMRKHCFQYTIRITNNSDTDTVQLLSRRFEIQTVGSSMKDVVQGEGVTGRQPVLAPGEVFEYTSTAPLSVRPIGTTIIAARMRGEYKYVTLTPGQESANEEQVKSGGDASATMGMFHFVFPEEQRVKPIRSTGDDDDDEDDDDETTISTTATTVMDAETTTDPTPTSTPTTPSPATTLPGDTDMTSGDLTVSPPNDSSDTLTTPYLRVQVTSTYRPERSDPKMDKHCFAYSVRITNTADSSGASKEAPSIQLVSRRFEIQTIGSDTKDIVQGPGVTGRQPLLKPGESFEYTSTAPLSVRPMREKTAVVARMEGEYSFVVLDGDSTSSDDPMKAKMGMFHFVLPEE